MLPLSLSWDHRVIDGAAAARFNVYGCLAAGGLPAASCFSLGAIRMAIIDIKVPDIGDFAEVAIIEVLVQPGDTIKAEQSLVTVESDKASMEIPSSHAGVVKELKVGKLGDKIAEGAVVLTLEVPSAPAAAPAAVAAAPAMFECRKRLQRPSIKRKQLAINSVASNFTGSADIECDLLVLAAGPGGYSCRFPCGRSGPEGRHRRALCDPGRRVPERRLHSFQRAAACRCRNG